MEAEQTNDAPIELNAAVASQEAQREPSPVITADDLDMSQEPGDNQDCVDCD